MQEFRNFVPEVNITQEFWEYSTEKELREVLEQFREWIETYGLEFLDKISIPTAEAREKWKQIVRASRIYRRNDWRLYSGNRN